MWCWWSIWAILCNLLRRGVLVVDRDRNGRGEHGADESYEDSSTPVMANRGSFTNLLSSVFTARPRYVPWINILIFSKNFFLQVLIKHLAASLASSLINSGGSRQLLQSLFKKFFFFFGACWLVGSTSLLGSLVKWFRLGFASQASSASGESQDSCVGTA